MRRYKGKDRHSPCHLLGIVSRLHGMENFIVFFGCIVIGAVIGILFTLKHTARVSADLEKVKTDFAELEGKVTAYFHGAAKTVPVVVAAKSP